MLIFCLCVIIQSALQLYKILLRIKLHVIACNLTNLQSCLLSPLKFCNCHLSNVFCFNVYYQSCCYYLYDVIFPAVNENLKHHNKIQICDAHWIIIHYFFALCSFSFMTYWTINYKIMLYLCKTAFFFCKQFFLLWI